MGAGTDSSTFKATPSHRLSGFALEGLPSQPITLSVKEAILYSLLLSISLLLRLIISTFGRFLHLSFPLLPFTPLLLNHSPVKC